MTFVYILQRTAATRHRAPCPGRAARAAPARRTASATATAHSARAAANNTAEVRHYYLLFITTISYPLLLFLMKLFQFY